MIVRDMQRDAQRAHLAKHLGNLREARTIATGVYKRALTAIANGCKKPKRVAFTALSVAALVDLPDEVPAAPVPP